MSAVARRSVRLVAGVVRSADGCMKMGVGEAVIFTLGVKKGENAWVSGFAAACGRRKSAKTTVASAKTWNLKKAFLKKCARVPPLGRVGKNRGGYPRGGEGGGGLELVVPFR